MQRELLETGLRYFCCLQNSFRVWGGRNPVVLMALDPLAPSTDLMLTPFKQDIVNIGNIVKCVWPWSPGESSTGPGFA